MKYYGKYENQYDLIPKKYIFDTIASEYSESSTYAVGDLVMYGNYMYKCNTAISTAEAWTAAHWTQVQLEDILSSGGGSIPSTTNVLIGDGSGNAADGGHAITEFLLSADADPSTPASIDADLLDGKASSAYVQVANVPTTTNLLAGDGSGGFTNSGKTTSSFATAAQGTLADNAIPNPTTKSEGQYLKYTSGAWTAADTPTEIPTQTGYSGKFLTTNGSSVSWGTPSVGSHTQAASTITAGTFPGEVVANNNTDYTTKQIRNIFISTADPSGGSNGDIWIKYTT